MLISRNLTQTIKFEKKSLIQLLEPLLSIGKTLAFL